MRGDHAECGLIVILYTSIRIVRVDHKVVFCHFLAKIMHVAKYAGKIAIASCACRVQSNSSCLCMGPVIMLFANTKTSLRHDTEGCDITLRARHPVP